MRSVHVRAELPAHYDPADVYLRISEFERYPEHSAEVLSVEIQQETDNRILSEWEVLLNGGRMRWKELDELDPVARTIRFRQTEGDIDHFIGSWEVGEVKKGCEIRFNAEFDIDLGPELIEIVGPIAENALIGNIRGILKGLFEDVTFPTAVTPGRP